MLSNCGAREDSWESLGQQGHQTSILWFSKGNQPWIFIKKIDAEAETPIPWSKESNHWKIPWCWKDWGREKWITGNEMVRWHPWLNGHEFEQTPGDGEGHRSLVCCSPWGCKLLDATGRLNNNCYCYEKHRITRWQSWLRLNGTLTTSVFRRLTSHSANQDL